MGYKIGDREYSFDSPENQDIIRRFVNREVYCCATDIVEYIISQDDRNAPFNWDDIENYFEKICPNCRGADFSEYCPTDIEVQIYGERDEERDVESFSCPVCGSVYEEEYEARECCSDEIIMRCDCCDKQFTSEEYSDLDEEPREVYEWWMISGWLGEKLQSHGCVIIMHWGAWIWGRCASGQAIYLDGVIASICYEMGILDGQEHSWAR